MSGLKATNTAATTAAVANRFVTTANMSLTPYTIANASPVWSGGCLLTVTHTTVAGADTLGVINFVGLDLHGNAITETITPLAGTVATGVKVFRSVTSATSVGWVAVSTADTIVIGCAAGSIVAIGGGILASINVNNVVATAFTVSDAAGALATIGASAAIGSYEYEAPWSGFLKIATTSTNDVTLVHSPGVPNTYADVVSDVLALDQSGLVNPRGPASFVAATQGAGDDDVGVRVYRKAIAFDDDDLTTGVDLYTPAVGDLLIDAWVKIDTYWDATAGLDIAQFGLLSPTAAGIWLTEDTNPVDLTTDPDETLTGDNILVGPNNDNLAMMNESFSGRLVPAYFASTDPLQFVVTQDGRLGGAASAAVQGAAWIYIAVATVTTL